MKEYAGSGQSAGAMYAWVRGGGTIYFEDPPAGYEPTVRFEGDDLVVESYYNLFCGERQRHGIVMPRGLVFVHNAHRQKWWRHKQRPNGRPRHR